jgi:hypothetical protein
MILTCADNGEVAKQLTWSSWTGTQATATGIVTWRACSAMCADSTHWDHTSADVTLTKPVREHGKGVMFTRLVLHVTGPTPRGFMRNLTFSEAPALAAPAPLPASKHAAHPATLPPAVPSGPLGYAQIEGFWVEAGGDTASQDGYTDPQIAAAITGAESSFDPGIIQSGVDYCDAGSDRAGWGLWQLTCGNSVPEYGTDFQILDPWNNAEAAVSKYQAAVLADEDGFDPWSTYTSGAYEAFLQTTTPATGLTDPGEYVQINATPAGTPASPAADPGSTYGPPMPGSATAYVFWEGQNGDLWEAQGPAAGGLSGPSDRGMGTLNSAPTAGVDSSGDTYVYWEGNGPAFDLWEAYYNGSAWVGPFNRGMGPLGSAPSVTVTASGTAYVFWKGANGDLWEAQGAATGSLSGPYDHGMGTLNSAPTAGVDSSGHTYVYWEGNGPADDLWEAYYNGSAWVGPYNRGMGTLGSAPSVTVTGSGTAYVFWKGTNGDLYEAQGAATGSLSGPYDRGMGTLGSAPAAGVGDNGYTYTYWEGVSPTNLWEGFYNGSSFVGPDNRGMGSMASTPTVAISS